MNTSKLTGVTRTVFVLTGTALTLYIGLATFGFVSSSKVHYANFVLAIMVLAAIHGVEVLLGEHAKAGGGFPARLRFRIGLLVLGAAPAVGGALYVRIHAMGRRRLPRGHRQRHRRVGHGPGGGVHRRPAADHAAVAAADRDRPAGPDLPDHEPRAKLSRFDRWLALALTIAGLALLTGWARAELSIFLVLAAAFFARVLYARRRARSAEG